MEENHKLYESILQEFNLDNIKSEAMKKDIDDLLQERKNICKILKISEFSSEALNIYEKKLMNEIEKKHRIIENSKGKQKELKDEINNIEEEIEELKPQIKELENKLLLEQKINKKLREELRIFRSKDKVNLARKVFHKKYRNVLLKYDDEEEILIQIHECNERKARLRKEKKPLWSSRKTYEKKVKAYKKTYGEVRKNSIHTEKRIDFLNSRIQHIERYLKKEKDFKESYFNGF